MGFGRNQQTAPQVSADRLAMVAGVAPAVAIDDEVSSTPRVSVEPDLSRIRRLNIEETPEEHKRRLTAKTMNFSATIIARLIILAALGNFGYEVYQSTGMVHRGVAVGSFAIVADLGRVILKAMEPGSK